MQRDQHEPHPKHEKQFFFEKIYIANKFRQSNHEPSKTFYFIKISSMFWLNYEYFPISMCDCLFFLPKKGHFTAATL